MTTSKVMRPDSEISSPIQVAGLINRLEDHLAKLQQLHIKQRLHIKTPAGVDQELVKDLRKLHLSASLDDARQVEELVKELKAWLEVAPVAHLSFSTSPSRQIQEAIIDWFHKEVASDVLVNFLVDGQLAAGFMLRTKNKIFDFSANHQLWEKRAGIAELVKHV